MASVLIVVTEGGNGFVSASDASISATSLGSTERSELLLQGCSIKVSHDGRTTTCPSGNLHITNNRIIVASDVTNNAGRDALHVASFPISTVQQGNFQQPWFSSNYFEFKFEIPQHGLGSCEISFDNGGGDRFMLLWAHVSARISAQREPAVPPNHPDYQRQQQRVQQVANMAVFLTTAASTELANEITTPLNQNSEVPSSAYFVDDNQGQALVLEPSAPPKYERFEKKNE
eukprot:m.180608 g.180608  ORF g.180608 m.180608 type:complete len:231 (-) comp32027_c0_seq5:82-774(-)